MQRDGAAWQVWIHLRRQTLLCYRDPTLYLSRVVMFLLCSIFFAWVYEKARFRNQGQARTPYAGSNLVAPLRLDSAEKIMIGTSSYLI